MFWEVFTSEEEQIKFDMMKKLQLFPCFWLQAYGDGKDDARTSGVMCDEMAQTHVCSIGHFCVWCECMEYLKLSKEENIKLYMIKQLPLFDCLWLQPCGDNKDDVGTSEVMCDAMAQTQVCSFWHFMGDVKGWSIYNWGRKKINCNDLICCEYRHVERAKMLPEQVEQCVMEQQKVR